MSKQDSADSGGKPTPKKHGRFRRAFFAGLATLLPTVLTIFIITFAWNFLSEKIANPITNMIEAGLQKPWAVDYYWKGVWNLPDELLNEVDTDETIFPGGDMIFEDRVKAHVPNWVGFILALILVFSVGFLFKGYLGRQAIRMIESWILRVPLIKVIYPYAKQVTEFFFKEKKAIQYESCVAVEYPRKGIYSVGFVTSEGFRQVSELVGSPVVSIFIPSSPTPVTGYTILVPRHSVTPLDMTVDEALRFTISGGVILPPKQVPPLALKTRKIEPAADSASASEEASDKGEKPEESDSSSS